MIEGPLSVNVGVWDIYIPTGGHVDIEVYEKDGSLESLDLTEETLIDILSYCLPVDSVTEAEQSNENGVNFLSIDITDDVVVQINSEIVSTPILAYSLGDFIVKAIVQATKELV